VNKKYLIFGMLLLIFGFCSCSYSDGNSGINQPNPSETPVIGKENQWMLHMNVKVVDEPHIH